MDFPSVCFLRRGISQQFRYFWVPGAFFSAGLVQAPAVFFPRYSDLSSGIFCVLRMLLTVFLLVVPVFWGSRSVFSAGLVQAPAVFFLRHPDFHLKSFTFYGCCLPCFFQPYRHFFPFFCLSRLWKTSCFPVFVRTFCMEPTRAHSHARNSILSSLSGFLFLLPQDMP